MRIKDHRGVRRRATSIYGLKPELPNQLRQEIRRDAVSRLPLLVRLGVLILLFPAHEMFDLPRYTVPAILRRGYCPTCGYPLTERVEDDGCTVCPECGSAWRRKSVQ
jgi:hypothetical protein